jgi:2-dehydro-3-deoxyphosphogluconate aldolase / (4S)-4-hydroxy-2-oxoglutarate aldolase
MTSENSTNRAGKTREWLIEGVLPVVVISNPVQGLQIAEGLCAGGIRQIEITLRTPLALQALAEIAKEFPQMKLSAGTVLTPDQFQQAADRGATLFISPGLTRKLADHALEKGHCWVPGVATASEMMAALELGFDVLKFFPAIAAGGPKALAAITAPLPGAQVIPTGGVTLENLPQWREIKAVRAVGGTWLTAGLDGVNNVAKVVEQRAAQAVAAWNGTVLA